MRCARVRRLGPGRLRQVLQSFVNDIEAAHGEGAPTLEAEWLDLLTYQVACATLQATAGWCDARQSPLPRPISARV